MKQFIIYFILLSFILINDAKAVSNLEDELQKKYQNINSLHTTFTQKLTHKESGSVEQRNGTLSFQKPLNVRWETQNPYPELLLITDKVIWNYLPDEEIAYKYKPNLMQDIQALVEVITGQAKLGEDFEVKHVGKEGELTVLQLFPYEPKPEMVEAIIGIDTKNMLIKKASIVDFYGNINTMQFTSIKINSGINKNTFSFTPPKGIDVEDGSSRVN